MSRGFKYAIDLRLASVYRKHYANHTLCFRSMNTQIDFKINLAARSILEASYIGLLAKLGRSRWPDIGQVRFLRVYGPRRIRGP